MLFSEILNGIYVKMLICSNVYTIMITSRRKLGDLGEKLAREYLEKQDYKIIGCNYQKRWGEIDLIVEKNKIIIFIEVKTRTKNRSEKYGLPEEAVNFSKQRKLIKTARAFLFENRYSGKTNWQIDVVAIEINEQTRRANLKHIKNAVVYDRCW